MFMVFALQSAIYIRILCFSFQIKFFSFYRILIKVCFIIFHGFYVNLYNEKFNFENPEFNSYAAYANTKLEINKEF